MSSDMSYPYEYEERRSTDIPLGSVEWILIFLWCVIGATGLAFILVAKLYIVGALLIAIPTFIGMVLKPTFALCVFLLVLPTGGGVGFGESFSLDKITGLALAFSFFLNIAVTRPKLTLETKSIWLFIALSIWMLFTSFIGSNIKLELGRVLTQFQLLVLILTVYWILTTNTFSSLKWSLRSFMVGTVLAFILNYLMGFAQQSQQLGVHGRYAATLGGAETINANTLAMIYALSFLGLLYLMWIDRTLLWRIAYCGCFLCILIALFLIGSRTAILALVMSIFSPLLFLRQLAKSPKIIVSLILFMFLCILGIVVMMYKGMLDTSVQERFTDVSYAEESLSYRMELNKKAFSVGVTHPLGAGYYGWFDAANARHWPHNDFCATLGIYGIPGVSILVMFWLSVAKHIKCIPFSKEKIFARTLLIFLLIAGIGNHHLFHKHYWVFMVIILVCQKYAGYSEPCESCAEEAPFISNEVLCDQEMRH